MADTKPRQDARDKLYSYELGALGIIHSCGSLGNRRDAGSLYCQLIARGWVECTVTKLGAHVIEAAIAAAEGAGQ